MMARKINSHFQGTGRNLGPEPNEVGKTLPAAERGLSGHASSIGISAGMQVEEVEPAAPIGIHILCLPLLWQTFVILNPGCSSRNHSRS
jgi:hypothetical protein